MPRKHRAAPEGPLAKADKRDLQLYALQIALTDAVQWIETIIEQGRLPRLVLNSPRLERLRAAAATVPDET